jgi:predicted GIY-YIG superfamily endonuclease
MSFWAYTLHCRGGYFYTGHTDDLEKRLAQHKSGMLSGFASDHLPVELVWSQEFPSRYEAPAAERQIKGWSRAKKMALIPSLQRAKTVLRQAQDERTRSCSLIWSHIPQSR